MSQWDDNEDPYNAPYYGDGGGPAASTQPTPDIWGGLGLQARQSAIDGFYQKYLGRSGSQNEYTSHLQNPGGLAAVEALIKNSPEAAAYTKSQVPAAPKANDNTPTPDPTPGPPPPPPTTPNPYDSGGLVPTDGTYPGGPPPQYGGGPTFTPPDYKSFIPPSYDFQKFTPTTAADLLTDPGYQVRFDRGLDAVRADKAASGVLNGGGTAKALLDYGQDSASQEFKNVDDRRLTDFNTNEGNRFKTYLSNVSTQYDTPYANAYKGALDTANIAQGSSQFAQNSNYNDWLSSYNAWRNSRNDAFDQKFKVSSF